MKPKPHSPGGQSSNGAGGMSPPNGVVIKQGISALDLALSFVAPATGRARSLVLTGPEQSSSKKIPPRTILAVFSGGKVSRGTEGVPWVFTKPKKVWIVDAEGQKPMILSEHITATQAKGVARHGGFPQGLAPATLEATIHTRALLPAHVCAP